MPKTSAAPQVSIIVPVYNVEAYLRRSLNSILAQTMPHWECICVDDGSPDGCGAILDEYAAKDARFVVIHKENGGVSSARNAGLDAVRGEYISFVDPDDWIEPDTYEIALSAARESGADLVQWRQICERKNKVAVVIGKERRDGFFNIVEDYRECYTPGVKYKLFRGALILENGIRFPVGVSRGEDTVFVAIAYALAQKCFFLNRALYHYDTTREASISHNVTPDMLVAFADALKEAFGFIEEAMRRETERQRDRETERQRDRETERQRLPNLFLRKKCMQRVLSLLKTFPIQTFAFSDLSFQKQTGKCCATFLKRRQSFPL